MHPNISCGTANRELSVHPYHQYLVYNYIYVTIGYLLHLRTDWRVMDGVTRPMYFWHGLKGLKFKSLDELYRYYSKEKPITYSEKGKYL